MSSARRRKGSARSSWWPASRRCGSSRFFRRCTELRPHSSRRPRRRLSRRRLRNVSCNRRTRSSGSRATSRGLPDLRSPRQPSRRSARAGGWPRMPTAGRRSRSAETPFLADLRAGWWEFRTRSWVWASVCHFGLLHLFVWAPLLVLGPVVAKTSLGGPSAWTTILAAGSAGAIAGGVVAVRLRPRRPHVVVFGLMLLFAPQLALLALAAPTFLIAGAALLGQAGMSALNITWFATLQARVPADALARVTSYDWFGSALLLPLGLLLVGPLAATFGTREILAGATVWAVASSAVMLALPAVHGFRSGAPRVDVAAAQ